MRIAIVGVGPVGGILASILVRANHHVTLIDANRKILSAICEGGLQVLGPAVPKIGGEISVHPRGVAFDFSEIASFDVVFICVKTVAMEALSKTLAKDWKTGPVLVSFQNGINPENILAQVAGPDNTLRVVVNYAGHSIQPGHYSLNWFREPNFIGALSPGGKAKAENIGRVLSEAGLKTQPVDVIEKYAFEKTVMNACLSPTCTLTGLTMGEAMAFPETRKLVIGIMLESFTVAEKIGWHLEHTLEDNLRYLEGGGPHNPSMAMDMTAGRPTEIDFFNGKICELGAQYGVPTPYNEAVTILVKGKEEDVRNRK